MQERWGHRYYMLNIYPASSKVQEWVGIIEGYIVHTYSRGMHREGAGIDKLESKLKRKHSLGGLGLHTRHEICC